MAKTLFIPGLISKTDAKNGVRKMKLNPQEEFRFVLPVELLKEKCFKIVSVIERLSNLS